MDNSISIRAAGTSDAVAIAAIYNHYIVNTVITFEESQVTAEDMITRIEDCQASGLPWLVAEQDGDVIGYCYASKWKGRCAYRYSVEATVYLHHKATGKGLGTLLYQALMQQLGERGIHAVICGIALPNEASVALHEKLGMKKVAHFSEVGFKFERWVDVGYWQRIL